jgi:hypothetical protein
MIKIWTRVVICVFIFVLFSVPVLADTVQDSMSIETSKFPGTNGHCRMYPHIPLYLWIVKQEISSMKEKVINNVRRPVQPNNLRQLLL